MSRPTKLSLEQLLELHKTLAEDMRHTSSVVWQFSVAIITLQGGAIAASGTAGFQDSPLGRLVVAVGFFLSAWFSFMLYRQAHERRDFRDRIWAVEESLRELDKDAFKKPRRLVPVFSSVLLALVLIIESCAGFVLSLAYLFGFLK